MDETKRESLLRKTIYFSKDEWKSIRTKSFYEEKKYSEIVREAVREYLGLGS
ncbi:hypothetical protein ACFL35_15220 [Candidatus Riflebacteria bacterium]